MSANLDIMDLNGPCLNLRVVCGESDKYEDYPLYEAIVYAARHAGLAGATATQGIMSFGASHSVHTSKIFSLSSDLPVVIDIIDRPKKIMDFLPIVISMVEDSGKGALITTSPVEVHQYISGKIHQN